MKKMKKIALLLLLSITLFSCKDSEEKADNKSTNPNQSSQEMADKDIFYRGDFIYLADAAVLKGSNFIYGVRLDEMAEELAKQVKPAKKSEFDMVEVVVKGIVSPKPVGQEGWDEIITIKEIIMVSKVPAKIDIKLEPTKE